MDDGKDDVFYHQYYYQYTHVYPVIDRLLQIRNNLSKGKEGKDSCGTARSH
jgi:hypothetical protein